MIPLPLPLAHTAHLIEVAVFATPVVVILIALLLGGPKKSVDE
jgi:hypothetical protein